jgi:hypothetical protein
MVACCHYIIFLTILHLFIAIFHVKALRLVIFNANQEVHSQDKLNPSFKCSERIGMFYKYSPPICTSSVYFF